MVDGEITHDTLLGGRVQLVQPRKGYRTAIDPVLLAAAVDARPGQSILDVGCGTGAVFLCLSTRVHDLQITGIEKSAESLDLAAENARLNDLAATLIKGDIFDPPLQLSQTFDHVVSNPPFWSTGRSRQSPDPGKSAADSMPPGGLERWIEASVSRLKHRGVLSLILPADAMAEAIAAMTGPLGGITVVPLWPKTGISARRVILQGTRGGRGPSVIHSGLVLHQADGTYTAAAQSILSGGLSVWEANLSAD